MSSLPATFAGDVIDQPARIQFEVFLDEHRGALNGPEQPVIGDVGPWTATSNSDLCRPSLGRLSELGVSRFLGIILDLNVEPSEVPVNPG